VATSMGSLPTWASKKHQPQRHHRCTTEPTPRLLDRLQQPSAGCRQGASSLVVLQTSPHCSQPLVSTQKAAALPASRSPPFLGSPGRHPAARCCGCGRMRCTLAARRDAPARWQGTAGR
jgi:hypothetical protein